MFFTWHLQSSTTHGNPGVHIGVGVEVGVTVGDTVGETVGVVVGVAVGVAVGVGIGCPCTTVTKSEKIPWVHTVPIGSNVAVWVMLSLYVTVRVSVVPVYIPITPS
jgi:hypothetical protein